MDHIKESAKSIATLVAGICVAVIASGVDGDTGRVLAVLAAIAGAVVTWAVPNQAPSSALPNDEYESGYAAAVEAHEAEADETT